MAVTDAPAPVHGNKECVVFLERYLEMARKGAINHIALAGVEAPDKIFADSTGSISFQGEIHVALQLLQKKIDEACASRLAPYDPSTPANQVCFNLSAGIASFDFLPWLLGAEMARRRAGAEGPLKINFFRNMHDKSQFSEYHYQMIENVLGPLVTMIGGEPSEITGGRGNFSTTYNEIVYYNKEEKETVPYLQPDPAMLEALIKQFPQKPITITFREAHHYPHRNSNLEAWLKFGKELIAKGEDVIFVRDTAKAEEDIDGVTIFPAASQNLMVRLCLYSFAKHNFFVSNGPGTLNFHLSTPFHMFIELDPEHRQFYRPGWPVWWESNHGIKPGEQFPWFTPKQKIVWEADTYENISKAWEAAQ